MAVFAGHHHVGEEVHLDCLVAVPLACLAPAAGNVEREPPGLVAPHLCLGKADKEVADIGKHSGVCRGIASRRTSDGRLVDVDNLVHFLDALDCFVWQRVFEGMVEMLAEDRLQRAVDEGGLAAPRHSGHADERPQRESRVHTFQIVSRSSLYRYILAVALATLRGGGYLHPSVKIGRRESVGFQHFRRGTGKHHLSAEATRARSHVNDVVGTQHHVHVVLHDDNGVARIAKLLERVDKADIVALMQPYARLVEDIKHVDQPAAYLRCQAYTLALSAGKACRGTAERKIVEPHIKHEPQARTYLFQYLRSYLPLLRA